jgi:hypothetical protein
MTLPVCDCGADAFAFKPGTDAETCELFGVKIVLALGERGRAWCVACWRREFQVRGSV